METDTLIHVDRDKQKSVKPRRNSISLSQSIRDWWDSPSDLTRASSFSSTTSSTSTPTTSTFLLSRLRNHKIEYDLYRAILSQDIFISPPDTFVEEADLSAHDYVAEFIDTEVDNGNFIHEFYLQNNLPNTETIDIIFIHGYMAASGYFLKNFEPMLRSKPGVRIHAIDLLGFGNSSRPKFPNDLLVTPLGHEDQIRQTLNVENWFIDVLEQWRKKRGIKKFKLIGHSMGAYLLSCYLMKYNKGFVDEFLVVSPMGTEPNHQSLLNNSKYQFNHHESGGDPFRELTANQKSIVDVALTEPSDSWNDIGRPKFPENIILRKLWDWHKSPFQILQFFGPLYSKLLSYWSFKRFGSLQANDATQLVEDNSDLILKLHYYSFSVFNQYQGSGELAITKLINHEILARLPLSDRGFVDYLVLNNIKTLWMYGDKDWMNCNGGKHIVERINRKKRV